MPTAISPLRRMWNSGTVDTATGAATIPMLTLEAFEQFESCRAWFVGWNSAVNIDQPHDTNHVTAMLKWTVSTTGGQPPDPGPSVAAGDDTPAYHQTKYTAAVTRDGEAFYVFDSIGTGLNRVIDSGRATLWFLLQNNFPVDDDMRLWTVHIDFYCYYRATQARLPT